MFDSIAASQLAAVSGGGKVFHSYTRETLQVDSQVATKLDRVDRNGALVASYREVSAGIYFSKRSGTCFAHPDGNEIACVDRRGKSMSFYYW
jgi:hypothetical protein